MATPNDTPEQQSEAQPGCFEYTILIVAAVGVALIILIGRSLHLISDEQIDRLQAHFKQDGDEEAGGAS